MKREYKKDEDIETNKGEYRIYVFGYSAPASKHSGLIFVLVVLWLLLFGAWLINSPNFAKNKQIITNQAEKHEAINNN